MNILDENVPMDQRAKLRVWRVPARQVGYDILRHPAFNTQAKRMGSVIHASLTTITVWRLHAEREERVDWSE